MKMIKISVNAVNALKKIINYIYTNFYIKSKIIYYSFIMVNKDIFCNLNNWVKYIANPNDFNP